MSDFGWGLGLNALETHQLTNLEYNSTNKRTL